MQLGTTWYYSKTISETDVYNFAAISGDFNPLSVNKEFAAKSKYKKRVVQNILLNGFISAGLTKNFKTGSVYLGQKSKFIKPVFFDDTICFEFELLKIIPKDNFKIAIINIKCYNQENELVATGEATAIPKGL